MQLLITQFLLFILPLVILPFGISYFETPKVIIAEVGVLLLFLICLLRDKDLVPTLLHRKKSQKPLQGKSSLPLLKRVLRWNVEIRFLPTSLFIAILVLSFYHLLFLRYPTTFFGNTYRGQGVLSLWVLLLFAFLSTHFRPLPKKLVIVLLGIQIIASVVIGTKDGRAVGTLGEPNALGAFAIFLWPFLIAERKRGRKELLMLGFSLLLSFTLIIFSGSRSVFIAISIQLAFLIIRRWLSFSKSVIVCLVLLVCSWLLPVFDTQTVYENRGEIWKTALIAGYEHPLTGWGFGNTERAFNVYNHKLSNRLQGYYVDSSHNIFLDWWVQGGIIGLTLFILTLFDTILQLRNNHSRTGFVIFIGLLTALSFNPVSIVTLLQFWWIVGSAPTIKLS